MLRAALTPALLSGHSRGATSDFWHQIGLLGRNNMERRPARELTSIRRWLKIKFLVISKLANN
jgi:hypothetical protein